MYTGQQKKLVMTAQKKVRDKHFTKVNM